MMKWRSAGTEPSGRRFQFGIRTLLLAMVVVFSFAGWRSFRGDTIFYGPEGAILILPDGRRIPTNCWLA